MSTNTTHISKGDSIAANRIIQSSVISAVAALVTNLPVYFRVPTLFDSTLEVPLMGPGSEIQRLPVLMVIMATMAAAIGAGLLLAALQGITESTVTIFCMIAAVLLLFSFGALFSLPVALNIQVMLATLHTITAVVITYVLTIWRHDHETP